jgi:hypothetical protein
MIEEKRIYVVVAGTVQVPASRRSVVQPLGRQIAQACHAIGLYRYHDPVLYTPITTIVLQARDSAELKHVHDLLLKRKIQRFSFMDTNTEAYGPGEVMTAFCTEPVIRKKIQGILDYLPLWGAS